MYNWHGVEHLPVYLASISVAFVFLIISFFLHLWHVSQCAQSCRTSPDFSQLGLQPRQLSIRRYSTQFHRIVLLLNVGAHLIFFELTPDKNGWLLNNVFLEAVSDFVIPPTFHDSWVINSDLKKKAMIIGRGCTDYMYSQLSPCRHLATTDTQIIWTTAKSLAKNIIIINTDD